MTSEPLTLFDVDEDEVCAHSPDPAKKRQRRSLRSGSPASTPSTSSRSPSGSPSHGASTPATGAVAKLLLTPTEAALALGIGRSKLYELMRCGRIESVLIDSSRRIPSTAVEHYVDELRRTTAPMGSTY